MFPSALFAEMLSPAQAEAVAVAKRAAKPSLNVRAKTIACGHTFQLRVKGASEGKVRWSSSSKKVATVSASGRVRGRGSGACVIRAKVGSRTLQYKISVRNTTGSIAKGKLRSTAFSLSLVSSAESSTIDYRSTYAYLEDIGDGRGYTGGIVGFTSGTGDMLEVVRRYVSLKPKGNPLKRYLGALKAVEGTDSHRGLGPAFERAWTRACRDKEMIRAQDAVLEEQYLRPVLRPALRAAVADGLSPLGQFIYYDALVVHGPGSDADSFGGIRAAAKKASKAPSLGGSEAAYLKMFLKARERVMLKEEAHSDLSRIKVHHKLVKAGNGALARPLSWVMYGDRFSLR